MSGVRERKSGVRECDSEKVSECGRGPHLGEHKVSKPSQAVYVIRMYILDDDDLKQETHAQEMAKSERLNSPKSCWLLGQHTPAEHNGAEYSTAQYSHIPGTVLFASGMIAPSSRLTASILSRAPLGSTSLEHQRHPGCHTPAKAHQPEHRGRRGHEGGRGGLEVCIVQRRFHIVYTVAVITLTLSASPVEWTLTV